MANRIVDVVIRVHRLDPTEAELWIIVTAENSAATGIEIRGRFVGPKSALSSTIEVAYPLRPFPRKPADLPALAARVVIPEPSVWKPDTPFVYDGVIELWENGERCDVRQIPGYKLLTASSTSSRSP